MNVSDKQKLELLLFLAHDNNLFQLQLDETKELIT